MDSNSDSAVEQKKGLEVSSASDQRQAALEYRKAKQPIEVCITRRTTRGLLLCSVFSMCRSVTVIIVIVPRTRVSNMRSVLAVLLLKSDL